MCRANFVLGALSNSTDGGASWTQQNPLMEGANVTAPPIHLPGIREVLWSKDGELLLFHASRLLNATRFCRNCGVCNFV
jgi:hypothetical protein